MATLPRQKTGGPDVESRLFLPVRATLQKALL